MEEQARPETGTMSFGADWPGVFIRGDCAFGFAQALQVITGENIDPAIRPFFMPQARALAELLASCNVARNPQADQRLLSWNKCMVGGKTDPPMVYALKHGVIEHGIHEASEDCFGYYTTPLGAVGGLCDYFKRIGEYWPFDQKMKYWRKGYYYAYIDEHEMNKPIL